MIGKAIGLSKEELDDLEVACLFHDVGKIKTPDSILLKPGKLTQSEYDEMIRHVEYGASILSKAPSLHKYIPAVRHHHERQDGKGYPDGLNSDSIPLFASIIAIADTYDAMTSTRPYRSAFSKILRFVNLFALPARNCGLTSSRYLWDSSIKGVFKKRQKVAGRAL